MRHYSFDNPSLFQTYSINAGEYRDWLDREAFAKAVTGYSRVLGVSSIVVRALIAHWIETGSFDNLPDSLLFVCQSELDSIEKFAKFANYVWNREAPCSRWQDYVTRVFSHTNINTGETWTWVDFIA